MKTPNLSRAKKTFWPGWTLRGNRVPLAVVLLLAAQSSPAAVVTQYTYSTTCKPNAAYALQGDCSTLDHLYQRAKTWTRQYPKPLAGSTPETPSIVLVSSTTIPISAIFRFYNPPPMRTSRGTLVYPPPVVSYFHPARTGNLEVDTYAAANLDREVTSTRALKIAPVLMPPEKGTARAHVGVVAEMNSVLKRQGYGFGVLWGLFGYNLPERHYIDVIDQRSGEQHRIFDGDTIVVEFDDGSTIVVKLQRSTVSAALVFVPAAGSARTPAGRPYTVLAKPAKPGNVASWIPPSSLVHGRLLGPSISCEFPAGQVCTSSLNVVHCANTRAFIGPC